MTDIPASKYTGTFQELLIKTNHSLVVTTYQAKKLVFLRIQKNKVNTHFINMARPMGLAYKNGRLSVGSGNSVLDYFDSKNAASNISDHNKHDGAFLHRRTHVTGDIDIHEMAFDDNGELWIVNTKMSCLCTLDVNYSFVPKWKPPFISEYDSADRCHLNGLAMRDGKPRYVTALGVSDEAAGWRSNKAFGGIVMDIDNNTIIASGLSMPHSPRWYQDKLWVLESGAGQLITIDVDSGEKTIIAEVPGFCRGIDFLGRYAVIGLSQVRETAMFAGLPLTKRKEDRQCGIWIVDLVAGESAGYLSFDTQIEEIFSVQCLPMKHPTLLGFDDTLLDSSYSVPANIIQEFVHPKPLQVKIEQARVLHKQGDYENATALYENILKQDSDNIDVLYNLGHALSKSGLWDKAIGCIDKVIAAQNDHAQAWNVRGHFYSNTGQFHMAIDNYDKAISIDQQYASAHYHKACAQLSLGDYESGLVGYEWRTRMPGAKRINLPHPRWQGEDITEKSLLVVFESSAEDAILFARYLDHVKQRCKRLIVVCDEPLTGLLMQLEGVDKVCQHGKLPSDLFDVYTLIGSLGAILAINVGITPQNIPYLRIGRDMIASNSIIDEPRESEGHKVAIVWSGGQHNQDKSSASFKLEDFMVLKDIPDIDFFSFQHNLSEEERTTLGFNNVTIIEPELRNYHQTAAFLNQMDFVVCAPSIIAHLAGALNLPTIVVTTECTNWRWKDSGVRNSWYPSVRVIGRESQVNPSQLIRHCRTLVIKAINDNVTRRILR